MRAVPCPARAGASGGGSGAAARAARRLQFGVEDLALGAVVPLVFVPDAHRVNGLPRDERGPPPGGAVLHHGGDLMLLHRDVVAWAAAPATQARVRLLLSWFAVALCVPRPRTCTGVCQSSVPAAHACRYPTHSFWHTLVLSSPHRTSVRAGPLSVARAGCDDAVWLRDRPECALSDEYLSEIVAPGAPRALFGRAAFPPRGSDAWAAAIARLGARPRDEPEAPRVLPPLLTEVEGPT